MYLSKQARHVLAAIILVTAFLLVLAIWFKSHQGQEKMTSGVSQYMLSPPELIFLRVAAHMGSISAANKLYQYYEFVSEDARMSIRYLHAVAESGNYIAQYNLAQKLLISNAKQDREEAKLWLQLAANQGMPEAGALLESIRQSQNEQ